MSLLEKAILVTIVIIFIIIGFTSCNETMKVNSEKRVMEIINS